MTVWGWVMLTTQDAVPGQLTPLHPAKTEPRSGVAVRVTLVPLTYDAEQAAPHAIPVGLLVTVPLPVLPVFVTISA